MRALLPALFALLFERVLAGAFVVDVSVGDVDVGLRKGVLVLEEAQLRSVETGAELFEARRVALDLDWGALLAGNLEAESLEVEAPELFFAFDAEDRFNWTGVGRPDDGKPPGEFRVSLARVDLGAGVVHFEDDVEVDVPDLALSLGAVSLDRLEIFRPEDGATLRWALAGADARDWRLGIAPGSEGAVDLQVRAEIDAMTSEGRLPFDFEVRQEGGVGIGLRGALQMEPFELALECDWRELRSRPLLPFLAIPQLRFERGHSTGALELTFTLDDVPDRGLVASGRVTHHDLEASWEGEGDPLLRLDVPEVRVDVSELRVPIPAEPVEPPPPVRVHWERIEIDRPALELTLAPAAASRPLPAARAGEGSGETVASAPRVELLVDALALADARVRVRAAGWDAPPLERIRLEAAALGWPGPVFAAGSLVVGSLGERPLRVEGDWKPGRADLALRSTRIALVPWNPLIESISDYSVTGGRASARGDFRLRGEEFELPLKVVLHQLHARSRANAFEREFGMPLEVALRTSSDSSGNIRLSLPIRGRVGGELDVDVANAGNAAVREALQNSVGNVAVLGADLVGSVARRVIELPEAGIGEALFYPGEDSLAPDVRVVLGSAAQVASKTPGARLVLFPEMSWDDLPALDIEPPSRGFGVGQVMKWMKKEDRVELQAQDRQRVVALAERRLDAAERHVCEKGGLARERVARRPWDGRLVEGPPRILLRLEVPRK